jgi:predicted Zn-dependent protease
MSFPRYAIWIILLGLAMGCATADLAPISSGEFQKEEDEKGLWIQSDRIARQIRSSDMIYRDDNLSAYINSVARGLFSSDMYDHIPFRVSIIKDPRLNAFALPNGDLFLHTGIVARMENEAQLATLLGHEMTHSTHRHSVRSLRNLKNKSALFSVAMIGGGDYGGLLGNLGFLASVSGYSKELERQADEVGWKLMVEAGYDPAEAPILFTHLMEDILEEGGKEPFFFGTHPRLQERIDNYNSFMKVDGQRFGKRKRAALFISRITRLIYDNAELDLKAGRFSVALNGVRKYVELSPDDPAGYCLTGDIWYQKDPLKGGRLALDAYRKAVEIDPAFAQAHRGLGVIAFKSGDDENAIYHLKRYIELGADNSDRAYIEQYIDQIKKRGGGS